MKEDLHKQLADGDHDNRYTEAFSKFEHAGSMEEITTQVKKICDSKEKSYFTPEVLKQIHGCIDLTSLTSIDTRESIWKLVDRVNDFEGTRPDVPNVAAICTYPIFVETVKQALTAEEVKIAAVAGGFPSAQTFPEVKVAEVSMAIMEGAEEIDTVMNLGYFLEENYQELTEELQEIKAACREAKLKVILETGALHNSDHIRKSAILALYSCADFLKTSTGKGYPGATPEAVYILCQVIKQYHALTGNKAGIKISGGIRTAEEAVTYYTLVKEILGESWINRDYLRFGASILMEDIEKRLGK